MFRYSRGPGDCALIVVEKSATNTTTTLHGLFGNDSII
jgi:hypothetical protein